MQMVQKHSLPLDRFKSVGKPVTDETNARTPAMEVMIKDFMLLQEQAK